MKREAIRMFYCMLGYSILFSLISPFYPFAQQDIEIEIRTITTDYSALKTSLQIPIFKSFKNGQIQDQISARVEEDVFGFLEELKEDSEKYLETTNEAEWQHEKYIGETIFALHYLSEKVLSFSIFYYSYTQGAHGFTEQVSYNFDLETGNEIKIEDLFLDYDQHRDLINQEIKRQITVEEELYFNEGKDFQSIKDNQPFYIQYDGIVVYFGLYEIAPYADGIRYFKIPFHIFNGLTSDHLRYFAIN